MLLFVFARVPYIQLSLLKNNALLFIGNWSFAKYGEVKRNMEHESQTKARIQSSAIAVELKELIGSISQRYNKAQPLPSFEYLDCSCCPQKKEDGWLCSRAPLELLFFANS